MIPKTGKVTITTAGTAVQLSATSLTAQRVYLNMDSSATGIGFAGDASVLATVGSAQGACIPRAAASAPSLWIDGPIDISRIYVDSTVNGDKVAWLAIIN